MRTPKKNDAGGARGVVIYTAHSRSEGECPTHNKVGPKDY